MTLMSRRLAAVGSEPPDDDVRCELLAAGDSVWRPESVERDVSRRTMGDDCVASERCGALSLDALSGDAGTARTVDRSGDASSNVCNACAGPALPTSSASIRSRCSCSYGVGVPLRVVPWLSRLRLPTLCAPKKLLSPSLRVEEVEKLPELPLRRCHAAFPLAWIPDTRRALLRSVAECCASFVDEGASETLWSWAEAAEAGNPGRRTLAGFTTALPGKRGRLARTCPSVTLSSVFLSSAGFFKSSPGPSDAETVGDCLTIRTVVVAASPGAGSLGMPRLFCDDERSSSGFLHAYLFPWLLRGFSSGLCEEKNPPPELFLARCC